MGSTHFDLILDVGPSGALVAGEKTDNDLAARPSTATTTKELSTLLKLVIGMAVIGYKYDPAAKRSDIPPEIARDVQSLGLDIDDDTVRKWLRRAAEIHLSREPS